MDAKIQFIIFNNLSDLKQSNIGLYGDWEYYNTPTRYSADQGYGSDTKFSGSLGGGLRLPFNDNVAATLGVRGYLTLIESDTSIFCKSDSQGGGCLVRSSGSTFFQAEALLGLTVRF